MFLENEKALRNLADGLVSSQRCFIVKNTAAPRTGHLYITVHFVVPAHVCGGKAKEEKQKLHVKVQQVPSEDLDQQLWEPSQ